ncbi:MAG: hypothetical protein D6806_08050 [Deltaproteobacteria bacterium]|nr:MAG: hypothetical protein D6806_08050 [Deltaproteobacteria bacterium]
MGFAAAALGNHEFDWGEAGLVRMLDAAEKPTVPLLASNIHFNPDSPDDDALEAYYGQPGESGKSIYPYVVVTTSGGVKVGLLGLMGLEAEAVSNAKTVSFSRNMDEMATDVQKIVNMLRNDEKVDLVVALAHLGITDPVSPAGESIDLARKTQGIDVILSGHTHTRTPTALAVASQAEPSWTTYVTEAGSYGRFLGKVVVARTNGKIVINGETVPIDDSLQADAAVETQIVGLIEDVEQTLLAPLAQKPGALLNGSFHQVLSHSDADLVRRDFENGNLGYMVADAMRQASGATLAFASNGGDLRATLPLTGSGGFDLQDAFIVTPLGTGPDGQVGYPLVKFYLSWFEIQLLMEATICDRGLENNDYMINVSGLRAIVDTTKAGTYACVQKIYTYLQLDESDAVPGVLVFDASLPDAEKFPEGRNTLVEVCTSWYIADQMTRFNVYPKDSSGNQITLEQALVTDGGDEVKLWQAFTSFLAASDPVPALYNDNEADNPAGPYWRRVWDIATHSCGGHSYCQ